MFTKFFFSFLFAIGAQCLTPHPIQASEEDLFARRIIEFWKDKDDHLVKKQIPEFLKLFPQSSFKDHFYAILGDLYLKEKDFASALEAYNQVVDPQIQTKTLNNSFYCLYQLKNYIALKAAIAPLVGPVREFNPLFVFYYAESFYRQALMQKQGNEVAKDLEEAKSHYEKLLATSYRFQAHRALAEISRLSGQVQKAAQLYAELIDLLDTNTHQQMREQAILQWMQIELSLNHQDLLIGKKTELLAQFSDTTLSSAYYLIGKAYFQDNDFKNGLNYFHNSIETSQNQAQEFYKQSFLLGLHCALHIANDTEFDKIYGLLERQTLSDQERLYVFFLKGLKEKQNGHNEKALLCFETVIEEHAPSKNLSFFERCYFEAIELFHQEHMWKRCMQSGSHFLDLFEKSSYQPQVVGYFFNAALAQLNASPSLESSQTILNTIDGLNLQAEKLTDEQTGLILLIRARALMNTHKNGQTLEVLNAFFERYPSHPQRYLAHYFMTLHLLAKEHDPQQLIYHAEKSLELGAPPTETGYIHSVLFNAYQQNFKNTHSLVDDDKASDHLYEIFLIHPDTLSSENHLWLAFHFFRKVESLIYLEDGVEEGDESALAAKKSLALFEAWLAKYSWQESPAYALGLLYLFTKQTALAVTNLEKLIDFQKNNTDIQLLTQSQLALANAYLSSGNSESARAIFEDISTKGPQDSFSALSARLKLARIRFSQLLKGGCSLCGAECICPKKSNERLRSSPEIFEVLENLKDIQGKRQLLNEPVHLEAALDYVFIRASLEPSHEQKQRMLSLLEKVKEDFTALNSPSAKDYHSVRASNPKKDTIFQGYMRLVDAYILSAQAEIERQMGNEEEARNKNNAAYALFASLRQGKFAVTPYIIEKATQGIDFFQKGLM